MPSVEQQQIAKDKCGDFWESSEMKALFPGKDGQSADLALMDDVRILTKGINDPSKLTDKSGTHPLTNKQSMIISKRCYTLRIFYITAMNLMKIDNLTWKEVISTSLEKLAKVGISNIKHWNSVI